MFVNLTTNTAGYHYFLYVRHDAFLTTPFRISPVTLAALKSREKDAVLNGQPKWMTPPRNFLVCS